MRKMNPNKAKKARAMAPLAALKRGFRKNETSSIGCGHRRSQRMNPVRNTTDTANPVRVRPLVQPQSGPWMMAITSAARPTVDNSTPQPSMGGCVGSALSGTSKTVATSASTAAPTMRTNTDPQ